MVILPYDLFLLILVHACTSVYYFYTYFLPNVKVFCCCCCCCCCYCYYYHHYHHHHHRRRRRRRRRLLYAGYPYTYSRANHVPRGYIVAAILSLLFMVPLFLVPALALLFFYVSTFRHLLSLLLLLYLQHQSII